MVAGKRQGEQFDLGENSGEVRPVLALYTPSFLTYLRAVFSGGALITYCLWAFSSAELHGSSNVLFQLSIVPFAVAILRYALLLDQGRGAEPENLVLSDRALLLAGAAWIAIYGIAIYTA
jgi:decaprenyl-phosphate phosphoribosyltransferase